MRHLRIQPVTETEACHINALVVCWALCVRYALGPRFGHHMRLPRMWQLLLHLRDQLRNSTPALVHTATEFYVHIHSRTRRLNARSGASRPQPPAVRLARRCLRHPHRVTAGRAAACLHGHVPGKRSLARRTFN